MSGCLACGHDYERHLFGGMCFYCDCKRAVYETGTPFGLTPHAPADPAKAKNGAKPAKKAKRQTTRRLGAS